MGLNAINPRGLDFLPFVNGFRGVLPRFWELWDERTDSALIAQALRNLEVPVPLLCWPMMDVRGGYQRRIQGTSRPSELQRSMAA